MADRVFHQRLQAQRGQRHGARGFIHVERHLQLVAQAPALDGQEDKEVTIPVGKTATRTMTAQAYLTTWALPNMYFHITTAYAILRHNGVVIGKSDYLVGAAA
mgnify:CR=1 FL=1